MIKFHVCHVCKGSLSSTAFRKIEGKRYCSRSCWMFGEGVVIERIKIQRSRRMGAQSRRQKVGVEKLGQKEAT